MRQQPTVQPAMQPLLARKLARLVADIFQVGKGDVGRSRKQGAQSSECAARRGRIMEAMAVSVRVLEKRAHLVEIEVAERRTFLSAQQNSFGSGGNGRAGAGADGSRSSQRNSGGSEGAKGSKTTGALAFFFGFLREPDISADRLDRKST